MHIDTLIISAKSSCRFRNFFFAEQQLDSVTSFGGSLKMTLPEFVMWTALHVVNVMQATLVT